MQKKLVLIGAGHAHLYTILRLSEFINKGISVTVISPCCYYYSGMIPGVLAGRYAADTALLDTGRVITHQGGRWIEEKAVRIDAIVKTVTTETGKVIPFDVLSVDAGSSVNLSGINITPEAGENKLIPVRPFPNIITAREKITEMLAEAACGSGTRLKAAVIGGGPAGVEIAGSLLSYKAHNGNGPDAAGGISVTLFAGKKLLPGFPEKAAALAIRSLETRGAQIITGPRVSKITDEGIIDENGNFIKADIILAATGVLLSSLPGDSGIKVSNDGGMVVDRFLRAEEFSYIFGGGDCITFTETPLPKLGVFPVRQGPVLFNNLLAALNEKNEMLKPYIPELIVFKAMNMGDKKAVAVKGAFVFHGKIMFRLKEYFDMKFIKSIKDAAGEAIKKG